MQTPQKMREAAAKAKDNADFDWTETVEELLSEDLDLDIENQDGEIAKVRDIIADFLQATVGDEEVRRKLVDVIDEVAPTGPFDLVDGMVMRAILEHGGEALIDIVDTDDVHDLSPND